MAESASGLIAGMPRTCDDEPDRVSAAWTDPKSFGSWCGPVGMKPVVCEVDPKVGGAWRLMGEGKEIPGRCEPGVVRPTVSGKYLEIEPPNRLVFTFALHETDDFASPRGQETIVTLQLKPAGQRTEMVFTQAVFKEQQAL